MGAERSQWQFPANEVGKVIGWSDEASPSNPSASKGLVNKGPFATPADLDGKQDASANLTTLAGLSPLQSGLKAYLGVPYINVVSDHGAVADVVTVDVTASISSGANALTATGATFTADDVGKSICVPGAGAAGILLFTTISGYTSATQVTLADNASTTLSAVSTTIVYGTDQTDEFQAAIDAALANGGGVVFMPRGAYWFDASTALDPGAGDIIFLGEGDATVLHYYEGTSGLGRLYLFSNTTDTAKGKLGFSSFKVRGTLDLYGRRGGNPFYLDYYSHVSMEDCSLDNIASEAMDFHFLGSFHCRNNKLTNIAADGIRCRDTPHCIVTGNTITRNGDDAIAIHTADAAIAGGFPSREWTIVANNTVTNGGMIRVLGGRQVIVEANVLDLVHVAGIEVAPNDSFEEGNLPIRDVIIRNNIIANLLYVTSGTPGLNGAGIQVYGPAPRGVASTHSTVPKRWDSTDSVFIYPWNVDNVETDVATNPVGPLDGIVIEGNILKRTLPDVSAYSDYGFGTRLWQGVEYDPAITTADFRQTRGITFPTGGLHNSRVCGNVIQHYSDGILFPTPTTDTDFKNVICEGNVFENITNRGIVFGSAAFSVDVTFRGNKFDGDPYRLAANSNIDGTYDADGAPTGIDLGTTKDARVIDNEFRNVCHIVRSTGSYYAEGNIVTAGAPAAFGFSTSNTGIGVILRAGPGFRYRIVNADPRSSTYDQVVTMQPLFATAMPSSGTFVEGAFVENTDPTTAAYVKGWKRFTTGTGNVLGTDWVAETLTFGTTYTPTLTSITNIDSTSSVAARYLQIGDLVLVWGVFTVDPTAGTNTASQVDISLPIASNFTVSTDLSGVAATNAVAAAARIIADVTNDRASMLWVSGSASAHAYNFHFSYIIK